ncbi:hypothetical protein EDD21DRAFT_391725 [Dissophora ornata]|nr:hypothetical protein BGZ58_003086 [Dissophora ornata]KAI8595229.1 hypothetical protein EDD21DRAFT_391725 [Dissophora ornata]
MEVQAAALIMPSASASPSSPVHQSKAPSPQPSSLSQHPDTTSSSLSISPENDPNPSWTFFPPSATYIPPCSATATSTGAASPPGSNSPSSPSLGSPRSSPPPSSCNSGSSTTPSTHHRILDHCFHLSIETRLKQAEAQYLASTQELAVEQQQQQIKDEQGQSQANRHSEDQRQDDSWRKRQRSLVDEAVVLGRKGSNVEAIVDGILKSHRSNGPLQTLPRPLKIRLHLCQLTSMVFGRFDVASSTNNSAGLNVYSAIHSRRHGTSRAAIKYRFSHSERGKQLQPFFSHPIPPSLYCRRHHRKDCKRTCCTLAKLQQEQQQALEQKKRMANNYFMNNNVVRPHNAHSNKQEHQRVTGLVDAVPAFLKCSAMSYRDIAKAMVDKGELEEVKEIKVLEGWYKLLLEMMTQAAIESYLCDENTGFDTILDVFSFGDDPDNDTALKDFTSADEHVEASSSSSTAAAANAEDDSLPSGSTMTGMEGLQFQNLSGLGSTTSSTKYHQQLAATTAILQDVTTQDRQDDILFAKTPEYEAFKAAKDQRLKEFLTLDGATMEQHFADLAAKYPLIVFERQATHFITRSQKLLVDPKLSQNVEPPMGLLIPPATSTYADGSLSMPVSEDEDEDDDEEMDDGRTKLEEIKEEDEREHSFPTPPASVVVIKEEMKAGCVGLEEDDDDNSTAARVSKKHKHHVEASGVAGDADAKEGSSGGHAAKKVKA